MEPKKLPITCPICGRKNEFPMESLVEGGIMACPGCTVKLTIHGHMWEEIKGEMERIRAETKREQ